MSHPVPPPGTFVLRRSPDLEERARRGLAVTLAGQLAGLVVGVVALALTVVLALRTLQILVVALAAGSAVLTVFCGMGVRGVWKWRRVERGLAGMELWIAPEGLTYVSEAGVFPAPWSALRGMYFGGRPGGRPGAPALFVEVDDWGGPLAEYATGGKPCSLRMPLAGLGADRPTIARAVHEISSGRVTVGPR